MKTLVLVARWILLATLSATIAFSQPSPTAQNPATEPSQNTTSENTPTPPAQNTQETDFFARAALENNTPQTSSPNDATTPSGVGSTFSMIGSILRVLLVLAIIIAAIYGVMYFFKKSAKLDSGGDDPFLRKVASINLGLGKTAQVVTLLDKAYIVGVADNSVCLIGEVTDKELISAMNLYADDKAKIKKPRNFSDILNIFMPGGNKKSDVYADSKDAINNLLQKQRDRLNKTPTATDGENNSDGSGNKDASEEVNGNE